MVPLPDGLLAFANDWAMLLALSALAGLVATIRHTPPAQLSPSKMFWNILSSMLVGTLAKLLADDFDWSSKRKLGAAVLASYYAIPVLDGGWRLAMTWKNDPTKFINRK